MSEEEKRGPGRPPAKQIDKHNDTVMVINRNPRTIEMKHQKLKHGEIGLATLMEQECLTEYLEVVK
jgi:hypothetical protein